MMSVGRTRPNAVIRNLMVQRQVSEWSRHLTWRLTDRRSAKGDIDLSIDRVRCTRQTGHCHSLDGRTRTIAGIQGLLLNSSHQSKLSGKALLCQRQNYKPPKTHRFNGL